MPELLVGPMLRYVDATTASVWVEADGPCTVEVQAGESRTKAETFTVHGHHYALVDVALTGEVEYGVTLDGERVWPLEGRPPSRIRPVGEAREVMFGSCRTSVPHDASHILSHGVDVLRAYSCHLMETGDLPDLLLLLGDQVYADEPGKEMLEFIANRRDGGEPVGEIADFEEYAELYRQAWTDPDIRWLLATVPSAMIFDDHDIRDDWNTSRTWREQMAEVSWWQRRLVAGLGAYWVYQHLGNLSPAERADDPVYGKILGAEGDAAELLDAFAERADADPASNRWSYSRDLGETRLIMLDSRCSRHLRPRDRRMIDAVEWEWLSERIASAPRRLLIGSSVPVLLPTGIHHIETWNEALSDGAWGPRVARLSERFRQAFDLEHWGAFRRSFEELCEMLAASGSQVMLLSGDVHYSYVAKAEGLPIYQIVCSPIRNPLSRTLRLANIIAQFGIATLIGSGLARTAKIPRPPFRWKITNGPWFSNALGQITPGEGEKVTVRWHTGSVVDDPPKFNELVTVRLPQE